VAPERIRIRVVCAEAGRQTVLSLDVEAGCTAGEALRRSGILAIHKDLDADTCGIGIFGREVPRDQLLQEGDRLEVLRPLLEDPRERRRRLAKQAATGKKSARSG
jgi:putative ubiquitin-RnfH superfamily antitoxin RatB of RatAB toxin-antitoxin module